jgi:hypothetical protein
MRQSPLVVLKGGTAGSPQMFGFPKAFISGKEKTKKHEGLLHTVSQRLEKDAKTGGMY